MNQQNVTDGSANEASSAHELFVLTDEQILEIEPQGTATKDEESAASVPELLADSSSKKDGAKAAAADNQDGTQTLRNASQAVRAADAPIEPPVWLVAQMKDPWSGEEARDLWNGVLLARQEAAAYREVFAKPEDARAFKELYPGGVSEARTVAERARALDDIDRAYFTGDATQRAQLATTMLREDPAAFREMVFAGLRALEAAEKGGAPSTAHAPNSSRLARAFESAQSSGAAAATSSNANASAASSAGQTQAASPDFAAQQEMAAQYAVFERAANDELERHVGGAIERTLEQALPNAGRGDGAAMKGRLAASIRQDVEKALQGDRQLGEQVGQVLSSRRLNAETRAQVVRLIGERAQQLVPGAAKRVLGEWTQTTLASRRARSEKVAEAAGRPEVAPAASAANVADSGKQKLSRQRDAGATRAARGVDYRRLSDEQILEL